MFYVFCRRIMCARAPHSPHKRNPKLAKGNSRMISGGGDISISRTHLGDLRNGEKWKRKEGTGGDKHEKVPFRRQRISWMIWGTNGMEMMIKTTRRQRVGKKAVFFVESEIIFFVQMTILIQYIWGFYSMFGIAGIERISKILRILREGNLSGLFLSLYFPNKWEEEEESGNNVGERSIKN